MTLLSMTVIGDKLKKARESKSLTIDQVQKATRIHSTVLVALEEGRCDKMLTPTYVKSFLKKYAEHLSLDAKEVMNDYVEAHPEARTAESAAPKPPEGAPADLMALARKFAPVLLAAAVFFVVVNLGMKFVRSLDARGRERAAAVGAKSRVAKAKKAVPVPEKAAPSKPAAPVKEAAKPEPSAPTAVEPRPQQPKNEPLNLVLKAKRDVFVMANIDGETAFKRHLPKGTVETMKADQSINLYIARGESVELILNGKTLGSFGRGVIKDLEITRKGVRAK